ncbi:MAG TPA: hypothetical protein PK133_12495 [Ferruginibacter sp.]|nr:hypothetical protein [Chitinophagaceae bacterium]MBP6287749.1 hypothetical protein [Ferruginibacter sp.]HQY13032.1 hypothetical protein [Ferruginibacter sp.]
MRGKRVQAILLTGIAGMMFSCSPKNISTKYYYQNEKVLDRIEERYKQLYRQMPFTIGFTDRWFKTVSVEIITDSLSYIYEFEANESRLADTLAKYHPSPAKVVELIGQMQSIRCTWIRNLDYYVDEKKNSLIFMSIKPVALKAPFSYNKYYVLTYFQQPQYFDSEGRLLDKRRLRRLRKINGEIFKRINDKVCYTISGNFR